MLNQQLSKRMVCGIHVVHWQEVAALLVLWGFLTDSLEKFSGSLSKSRRCLNLRREGWACCDMLQLTCRAQVLLAAAQSPLLAEKKLASVLIPRLCNSILTAPSSSRHVSLPAMCSNAIYAVRHCLVQNVAVNHFFSLESVVDTLVVAPTQLHRLLQWLH